MFVEGSKSYFLKWIFGTQFKFSFCDKFILVCFGWGPDFDSVDFGNHTVISRQPISSKHCLEIKCRLRFDIWALNSYVVIKMKNNDIEL